MPTVRRLRVVKALILVGLLGFFGSGAILVGSLGQSSSTAKPELHPFSLALLPPSPVQVGQRVVVKVMVENRSQRGVADSGAFSVGFYYRILGETQWTLFGQERFELGLKSNEMAERSVEFLTTAVKDRLTEKSDAIVEIRALVDFKSESDEQDERNNQLISVLSVRSSTTLGRPDLSPIDIRFECAALGSGSAAVPGASVSPCPVIGLVSDIDYILITTHIANLGDTTFKGVFRARFSICRVTDTKSNNCAALPQRKADETLEKDAEGSETLETLEAQIPAACGQPGKCAPRQIRFPVALGDGKTRPAGTYRVEVQIIPPSGSEEMDSANNTLVAYYSLAGPELRPVSLEFRPSVVRERGKIEVFVEVKNEGKANIDGKFDVQFNVNGRSFGGETGDVLTVERLNVGQSKIFHATLLAEKFNLRRDQTISIQAKVDPDNTLSELDETNNTIESKLTVLEGVPPLAELRPKALILNPPSPVEKERLSRTTVIGQRAQTVRLVAQILNTGNVKVDKVRVCFSYRQTTKIVWQPIESASCPATGDSTISLEASMDPDSKGIDAFADLNVDLLDIGSYEVRVVVDPPTTCKCGESDSRGQIPELDENNNEAITHILLLAPVKPDLRVSLRIDPIVGVNFGSSFKLSAAVFNAGDDLVNKPFKVQFRAQHIEDVTSLPQVLASETVNVTKEKPLLPGQTREITINVATGELPPLTPGAPYINRPGFYRFEIVADPDNQIDEQDKTNNSSLIGFDPSQQTGAFKINGPDLFIQPIGGVCVRQSPERLCNERTQFSAGETLRVTVEVQNFGIQIARSFNVEIRLCRVQVQQQQQACTGSDIVSSTTVPMAPLENNKSATTRVVEIPTAGLTNGSYQIVALVDPPSQNKPFGDVLEERELNNQSFVNVQISGTSDSATNPSTTPTTAQPYGPCFGVETNTVDLRVGQPALDVNSSNIARDSRVAVSVVVDNAGRIQAPVVQVLFGYRRTTSIQVTQFALLSVEPLVSCQAATLQAVLDTFTLDLPPGDYEIIVKVDPFNVVREDNEGNNESVRQITIKR